MSPGAATEASEIRKHNSNDGKCGDLGWVCIPLVGETYGVWGVCVFIDKLCQLGTSYGYYPEPKKTVIVVDKKDEESANACFHNSGIKVFNGYLSLVDLLAAKSSLNSILKIRLMLGWCVMIY